MVSSKKNQEGGYLEGTQRYLQNKPKLTETRFGEFTAVDIRELVVPFIQGYQILNILHHLVIWIDQFKILLRSRAGTPRCSLITI